MSLALKASGELTGGGGASSPKRQALPDALLRGIKLHQPPDPPVYIPNLQEETILAVSITYSSYFMRRASYFIIRSLKIETILNDAYVMYALRRSTAKYSLS